MFRLTPLTRRILISNLQHTSSFHTSTSSAAMALTPSQIAIVKSTVPMLKQHGDLITTTFYTNLIAAHPQLQNYFSLRNQATGAQQAALAASVLAYASYIDDLPRLRHAVERIAQKHTSLFVKPEQYAIVGQHLVAAFAEVLGDGLTEEVAEAWKAAYAQLADVFINREKQIYDEVKEWQDWRDFTIVRKEDVSEGVVSFYLEPVDKATAMPSFLPGQYVSLQIPIQELGGMLQSRQYSLSAAPGDSLTGYRVTIKKEGSNGTNLADIQELAAGHIAGIVGNRLHAAYKVGDTVQLSPPRGEFVFDTSKMSASAPVVLLSAGVGATPLLSILDSLQTNTAASTAATNAPRPVTWAHAARNSNAVCYGRHVRQAAADANANFTAKVFLNDVAETDNKGVDYDYIGRFDLAALVGDRVLPLGEKDSEYFLCGPARWMVQVRSDLHANGVSPDKVHLELFATGDV